MCCAENFSAQHTLFKKKAMINQIVNIVLPIGGFLLGGAIGVSFGMIQDAAFARNQKRQQSNKISSGWAVMPGSMSRVAYLLVVLALIQVACPLLFEGNTIQWIVSAGVVLGYGWMLYSQFRRRGTQMWSR